MSTAPKYELLREQTTTVKDRTLYRIRALRDFGSVKAGDLGGYVQSEDNLSHERDCWIADEAKVYDNARVSGEARVSDTARVYGGAIVSDFASIAGHTQTFDRAQIHGHAKIAGTAHVSGDALVSDEASVLDHADVSGQAVIKDRARVCDNAQIEDRAWVGDTAHVYGNAWVEGTARVLGNTCVGGYARVHDDASVRGNARVGGRAQIGGNAVVDGSATVNGDAVIHGKAQVSGLARVGDKAVVGGDAVICEVARVGGDARIDGNTALGGYTQVYGNERGESQDEHSGEARQKAANLSGSDLDRAIAGAAERQDTQHTPAQPGFITRSQVDYTSHLDLLDAYGFDEARNDDPDVWGRQFPKNPLDMTMDESIDWINAAIYTDWVTYSADNWGDLVMYGDIEAKKKWHAEYMEKVKPLLNMVTPSDEHPEDGGLAAGRKARASGIQSDATIAGHHFDRLKTIQTQHSIDTDATIVAADFKPVCRLIVHLEFDQPQMDDDGKPFTRLQTGWQSITASWIAPATNVDEIDADHTQGPTL